jgi:PAS domain S-box-containing protein
MNPYCSSESSPLPSSGNGLGRLLRDLHELTTEEVTAPTTLRHEIFARIDAEPARVETDPLGHIVATNPAFSALCGYAFSEIRGKKPGSFLQGELTEAGQVKRLREAIRAKQPVEVEITNYHKNGNPYRVRISVEPVFDQNGTHLGFRATERKLNA